MVNLKVEGFEDNTKIQEQLEEGIKALSKNKPHLKELSVAITVKAQIEEAETAYASFDGIVDNVKHFEIGVGGLIMDSGEDIIVPVLLHEIGHIICGHFDKLVYLSSKFNTSKTVVGRVFYGVRRAIHVINDIDILKEIVVRREERVDRGLKVSSMYERRYQEYLGKEIEADNIVMEALSALGLDTDIDAYIDLLKTNHCKYGIVGGNERIANVMRFKNSIKNSISNKRV